MAVTIEIDATLLELMQKLECSPALMTAAAEADLTIEYLANGVLVKPTLATPISSAYGPNKGTFTEFTSTAPIKLGVLEGILSGNLPGGAAKNLAKIGLEKAVKTVLAFTTVVTAAPAFLKPSQEALNPTPAPPSGGELFEDLSKIFSDPSKKKKGDAYGDVKFEQTPPAPLGPKVKLSSASILYQPVAGSDPTSIYYTIAISEHLNVAVRAKGKISIRAEGPALAGSPLLKKMLEAAGLSGNDDHYSVHLQADSPELGRKAVGAVLFGIGFKFDKIASDLTPIWGKGQ